MSEIEKTETARDRFCKGAYVVFTQAAHECGLLDNTAPFVGEVVGFSRKWPDVVYVARLGRKSGIPCHMDFVEVRRVRPGARRAEERIPAPPSGEE